MKEEKGDENNKAWKRKEKMKQPKKRREMREGKGMADQSHKLLHVPNIQQTYK